MGWKLCNNYSTFVALNDELEISEEWIIHYNIHRFSFAQGGIVIFNSDTHSIAFDLVTMSGYKDINDTAL